MFPCTIKRLTPAGLEDVPYTAESLKDAVAFEPEGVYTVTNTYNVTQVLKLDAHLDRMEDSARREQIPLRLDRPRLRQALRTMIEAVDYGNVRFRVTAPRAQPDHFILALEPFAPPGADLIATGVRCMTVQGMARRNPSAKTNDWARVRSTFTLPPSIYEGLLINPAGEILEGFTSNFYAILNGTLRTAGAGVLAGIAQGIVFEIAEGVIPVQRIAIRTDDLSRIDEAFLTSSSRGIIPIVAVDGVTIGSGLPGAQTGRLRERYNEWVAAHLEEL
jgi:branched-chain amino acid aminotransferase